MHDLQREVDRLNNVIKGLEKTVRDRDDEIEVLYTEYDHVIVIDTVIDYQDLKRQLRQRGKEVCGKIHTCTYTYLQVHVLL